MVAFKFVHEFFFIKYRNHWTNNHYYYNNDNNNHFEYVKAISISICQIWLQTFIITNEQQEHRKHRWLLLWWQRGFVWVLSSKLPTTNIQRILQKRLRYLKKITYLYFLNWILHLLCFKVFAVEIQDRNEDENPIEEDEQITSGNHVKFATSIDNVFKLDSSENYMLKEEDKLKVWFNSKDLSCNCPKIRLRRKYLIMTKSTNLLRNNQPIVDVENSVDVDSDFDYDAVSNSTISQTERLQQNVNKIESSLNGILIDRDTLVFEWKSHYVRRMRRFSKYFQNGKCS